LIFAISYLGRVLYEDLYIFNFDIALEYIDWNVVFLIMGMMIVVAVIERTGIFQWLAFMAYRISGGRAWLLLPILMVVTGVASSLLDNVTTMLLMTPITVQIAIAMGINPLALLMPELMASNVVGISTLIGTPTNILIGSYAKISFNAFLTNLTPGVLLSLIALIIYSELVYRRELQAASEVSPMLLEKLADRARITEPKHLMKAGCVALGMLVLFVTSEHIHLHPAVTALMGATALLVWIRPDIEEMIEAVDWTTLVFFITLFIVVGAIREVGVISFIAGSIGHFVGDSLLLAMLSITWVSAILSTVVANIPFTASMLPVVGFLTAAVTGADSNVLFFCLAVGAAMGGNGSLIGASANMVTAGIAYRAGYPISYKYFFKKGFPALLLTVAMSMIWLLVHFPGGAAG
jgi:Na+/H+ antiporter NhaD/arsenite permease-like protein